MQVGFFSLLCLEKRKENFPYSKAILLLPTWIINAWKGVAKGASSVNSIEKFYRVFAHSAIFNTHTIQILIFVQDIYLFYDMIQHFLQI